MDPLNSIQPPESGGSPLGEWRRVLDDAIRYWEPRRLGYNLVLTTVVAGWLTLTWPHFRDALTLQLLLAFFVYAVLANICYCAAYLVDVVMQSSSFRTVWQRRRWGLWLVGTLFATALANYWIADEIYPYVR
jgi:hypothetical protein